MSGDPPPVPSSTDRPPLMRANTHPPTVVVHDTVLLPTKKEDPHQTFQSTAARRLKMGFEKVHKELVNFFDKHQVQWKKPVSKPKVQVRPEIIRIFKPEDAAASTPNAKRWQMSETTHDRSPVSPVLSRSAPVKGFHKEMTEADSTNVIRHTWAPKSSSVEEYLIKDARGHASFDESDADAGAGEYEKVLNSKELEREKRLSSDGAYEDVFEKEDKNSEEEKSSKRDQRTLGEIHTGEKAKLFFKSSIKQLGDRLMVCGLQEFAVACEMECLDGAFMEKMYVNELKEQPFNLSDFHISKLHKVIDGWTPTM